MTHPHAPHTSVGLHAPTDPFDLVAEAAEDAVWFDRVARLLADDLEVETRAAASQARQAAPGRL